MALQVQVLILIGAASAILACPAGNIISDFDDSAFEGNWYWTEYYDNGPIARTFAANTACISQRFTLRTAGNFTTTTRWKNLQTTIGGKTMGNFEAYSGIPNQFYGTYQPGSPLTDGRYYIIDVQYNSVAVMFFCRTYFGGLLSVEMAWVLHRTKSGLSNRQRNKLLKRWDADPYLQFLVDPTQFKPFPDTDCTEYYN